MENPHPLWVELRALGPAVRMEVHGFYALPRFASSRAVLGNWRDFSSARGVMLNDECNRQQEGATIHSDPPRHDRLRSVVGRPLLPAALAALRGTVRERARLLVDRLVDRRRFDGVADLAQDLPTTIVARMVGLPEAGQDKMLDWATAAFDWAGPRNDRCRAALPLVTEAMEYSFDPGLRRRLSLDPPPRLAVGAGRSTRMPL